MSRKITEKNYVFNGVCTAIKNHIFKEFLMTWGVHNTDENISYLTIYVESSVEIHIYVCIHVHSVIQEILLRRYAFPCVFSKFLLKHI